jgi:hypothetical protein
MAGVVVLILHRQAASGAGPLERWVADARLQVAEDRRMAFVAAGARDARIVSGPPDDTTFGARLRAFVEAERPAGLVVLGSGSIPLARPADLRAFLAAGGAPAPIALTNNRFSADVVAVSRAEVLREVPDLTADNALPRWLDEVCGYPVAERRGWHLGVDVDGPLDVVLLQGRGVVAPPEVDLAPVLDALERLAAAAADRRAEVVVAGRTSAATLAWLERYRPARVRALVEERGLRGASLAAIADPAGATSLRRPPASVLGALLDRDGPAALGGLIAKLGDGAAIDSRVLLAHRHGADERAWPSAEDRFASDLLLADRIADPWLRELTTSAATASVPIVLGGHTLVGPGLRLALRHRRKDG